MGFYGTLKMIFYKVSRICACIEPPVSPPTHPVRLVLFDVVALIIFDAPLTVDCAATAEDEQQCRRPPETPL